MAPLSLRDAAKAVGVSRTTILRAIQSGRMSAPRREDGNYAIDPAELFRVFEPRPVDQGDSSAPRHESQSAPAPVTDVPGHVSARVAALEAEVQGLKEVIRRLDLTVEDHKRREQDFQRREQDAQRERDAWRSQAETTQRLLTATSTSARRGLWGWFRPAKTA
jgi:excisionase family DNA binding protein